MRHPTPLRIASALGSTPFPPPWLRQATLLPKDLLLEGRLSAEQLETVVYATQSHETPLPEIEGEGGSRTVMRRAFLLGASLCEHRCRRPPQCAWRPTDPPPPLASRAAGDAAGVGKGRQIAATIIASILGGKARKALWVSVSADLATDAARDVYDLLGPEGFKLLPIYRIGGKSQWALLLPHPPAVALHPPPPPTHTSEGLPFQDLDSISTSDRASSRISAEDVLATRSGFTGKSKGAGSGSKGAGAGAAAAEGVATDDEDDEVDDQRQFRILLEKELHKGGSPTLAVALAQHQQRLKAESNEMVRDSCIDAAGARGPYPLPPLKY